MPCHGHGGPLGNQWEKSKTITITFSNLECQCWFRDISGYTLKMKTPSLESFIQASTAMEDQELRLSGLAVFANACQPLPDLSKAKIQVNKILLVSLASKAACPLQGLVEHAQNAGYSIVIFLRDDLYTNSFDMETPLQDKLVIPVLMKDPMGCYFPLKNLYSSTIDFVAADRTNIKVTIKGTADDLKKMQAYLRRLYYWFLLGPVITFEWLRRTKKLCCMSGDQQAQGELEETVVESGFNSAADYEDTQGNYNTETEHEQTGSETQPLLLSLNDPFATGHRRPSTIRRVLTNLSKLLGKLALNSDYVILIVVALPVGLSSGGWSFFRFDQNDIQEMTFWDDLFTGNHSVSFPVSLPLPFYDLPFYDCILPLWWPTLQILCFFLYSRFACKTTWTVQTNFSKLIRSDWFASNMYLLILGVVVPYCSLVNMFEMSSTFTFAYYATYNMVCTICNVLFIIILNKHKFVTRYVFYISVCMICAYIESDIVAVFYFMLNSKGSLFNLKLTALRTVAIGLTLTLSLSSSMHIIRKLTKPRGSLFEGLGEK